MRIFQCTPTVKEAKMTWDEWDITDGDFCGPYDDADYTEGVKDGN